MRAEMGGADRPSVLLLLEGKKRKKKARNTGREREREKYKYSNTSGCVIKNVTPTARCVCKQSGMWRLVYNTLATSGCFFWLQTGELIPCNLLVITN